MEKHILYLISILFLITLTSTGCSKDNIANPPDTGNNSGIPKFVGTNYIDLSKIYRISKFRSSIGHDYSDAFEHCRSMKHYFEPADNVDWSAIIIYAPVTGIITRVDEEWAGTKLEIASNDYPAFRFSIFHINKIQPFNINDTLTAGEILGNHIGPQTYSDIAVIYSDSTGQSHFVSYFDVITDKLFKEYSGRGVGSREDLMILKAIRDANPLTCDGETFTSVDTLQNWFVLK